MLGEGRVAARIPTQDLDRARRFYAEKLGLEEVDVRGLRTVDGIADIEGQYPSTGASGERAGWFHDSEGNLLGVGQLLP
jgi:catechol 2,3-dioxygenase-like lactoylglutathione lyase family enzyme